MRRAVLVLAVGALCATACDDDNGGNDGNGGFDGPASLILPDRSGGTLRIDPNELNVKRQVTVVASVSVRPSEFNTFTGEPAEERSDAIYALDYSTGLSRLVVDEPQTDRLSFPLFLRPGEERPYYLTFANTLDAFTVHDIDLASGAIAEVAAPGSLDGCDSVVGSDYYYGSGADLLVLRAFLGQSPPVTTTPFADLGTCGLGLYSLDARPVRLTREVDIQGTEAFVLSAVDPVVGSVEGAPLAVVPVDSLTTSVRDPLFIPGEDGLYVLSSDFVSLELWRADYARRPGDPGTGEAPAPTLLVDTDPSFFSELALGGGVLSFASIFGFSVSGDVVALGVEVLEEGGGGNFSFAALVVADLTAGTADLIDLGVPLEGIGVYPTP